MKRLLLLITMFVVAVSSAFAQNDVSGRVTDSRDGTPVSGASVTVKGSRTGTTTDVDGRFRLSAPANSILVISSIGFTDLEIAVDNRSVVDAVLVFSTQNLQEVVVTGYTTQNKKQVAGSVAKLKGDEIRFQPVGSFDKALQGKVAGLLSMSQSGQPGAPAVVTIRGKGSINGTNTPLYIVDGIQVNAADFQSINPGDIESYNVLKDASSTAIYGSRGANGVIVITTKKGAAGQTRVNYDFQYGWSALPNNKLQLMNSAEKLDYELNYDRPFYGTNPFGWTAAEVDSLSNVNHDIEDVLFRKGMTQSHQLSVSGGNDRTRFYISGSYYDQEGVVITTGLKRYTTRINVENSFNNWKVGINMSLGYSRFVGTRENDQYIGSPLNAIRWFNPYLSLYDENGEYQDDYLQGQPNPLRELLENNGNNDQLKGVGNIYVDFNVPWVKGMKFRTVLGGDFTEDENFGYLDRTTDQGSQSVGGNGQVDRAWGRSFRYTSTTSLGYTRAFGEHEISATGFFEVIQGKTENFAFTGFGLVGPFKNESGITPGTPTNGYIPAVGGGGEQNGLVSYFVDANYGFRGKYYINAGARRDGSSRLSEDQQWANFGQVGLSWIVSEETFLEGTRSWLNSLKYKISYGSVGSQGVGNYTARQLLSSTAYNGVGGLLLTNLERPLTWERKVMFNTGIEFTTFKGRFGGTIEYYNNITKDLFLDRQLSRTSGFQSITNNLGELQNQGIEVSFNVDVIRSKDFVWSFDANYTYNKNKLLDQSNQDENISGLFINKVGQPINTLYVVRYAGVDDQTGEALYYRRGSKETTSTYDPDDREIIGAIDPPHYGGFTNNFSYKGIELNVLFSFAWGHYIYNNDRFNVEYPDYWYSNLAKSLLREWREPGDITDIPSPFNEFHAETTRFIEKADFFRLRNVTLAYNLPQSLLSRAKIRSARIFAQGQNLHVWHNFQGYDPEVTAPTLGGAQYPQLTTITFGLNLGL